MKFILRHQLLEVSHLFKYFQFLESLHTESCLPWVANDAR